MKFFVTGATGFIGIHLCRHLIKKGHEVVALVRNDAKLRFLPKENIEILRGNLESFKDPNFIIPKCDQVIHLAGTVTARKLIDYEKDNLTAVKDLLDCLHRQSWTPTQFVFASSQAAAGPSPIDRQLVEPDTPQPIDAYGRAKLAAENILMSQNDFPVTIIRPPSVIGPLDTNILNLFKMAKHGFGFILRKKKQPISFIAIDDLIKAIDLLIFDHSHDHRLYFVSNDTPTTPQDLWKEVGKALDKSIRIIPVPKCLLYIFMKANTFISNLFRTKNIFDKKYYDQLGADAWMVSSKKLKNDFDWQATVSLSEALKETVKSYYEEGWI